MKKIVLAALAMVSALLWSSPTFGQGAYFIVNDGANISSLIGLEGVSPKVDLYSEVGIGCKFNSTLGMELGASWSAQGATYIDKGSRYTYDYNYLNIPLLFTVSIPKHITLLVGAQAGAFLDATYAYEMPSVLDGGTVLGEGKFDKSEFHPWDFGATLGIRCLMAPKLGLGIEMRYTMGVTQTHNGVSDSLSGRPHISVPDNRNSVFRVGVFINLPSTK